MIVSYNNINITNAYNINILYNINTYGCFVNKKYYDRIVVCQVVFVNVMQRAYYNTIYIFRC